MDVRIGNDIKIRVTLDSLIQEGSTIVCAKAYIVNISDVNKFHPIYNPEEHAVKLCGHPQYNVLPTNPPMHQHCVGCCGNCHSKWKEAVYSVKQRYYMAHTILPVNNQNADDSDKLCIYFPAKDQEFVGKYKLVLQIDVKEDGWGINNVHTYTTDYGHVFSLTDCQDGQVGSIVINLPCEDQPSEETYNVTVVANPSSGGIVSGGGTYKKNEIVELKAVANDNYIFVGWNDGINSTTRTIVVTENIVYCANFESNAIWKNGKVWKDNSIWTHANVYN